MSKTKKKRDAAERERLLTSVLIPLFSLLALLAIVAIFASKGVQDGSEAAEEAPAPTEAPYIPAAERLHDHLGGELVNAEGFSSVAYKSGADGAEATVKYYMKSGLLCVSAVRTIKPAPEPTEDIFGGGAAGGFSDGRTNTDIYLPAAEEICAVLAEVREAEEPEGTVSEIAEILMKTASGEVGKAQMLYGVYTVFFSYSASDGLISIICEPA